MSTEEAKAAVKAVLAKNAYLTSELRYDRKKQTSSTNIRVKDKPGPFREPRAQATHARENWVPAFEKILFKI